MGTPSPIQDSSGGARLIGPAEVQRALLVDVREPHEFAAGHVPGAVCVPLAELDPWAQTHRDATVVVMCGGLTRGQAGAVQLLRAGLRDVAVLDGGTQAWAEWSGLPLATA